MLTTDKTLRGQRGTKFNMKAKIARGPWHETPCL